MTKLLAQKIRLDPTFKQVAYFRKLVGYRDLLGIGDWQSGMSYTKKAKKPTPYLWRELQN